MTNSPLRVVHLIPHDGVGGVEIAARSMAMRDDLPIEFTLLPIAGKTEPGARIVQPRRSSPLDPRAVADALRQIDRLQPDVLIASLWKSAPVALLAKRRRPAMKLVAFLHSAERVHLADRWLTHRLLDAADSVWADSSSSAAAAGERPVTVISFVLDRLVPALRGDPEPVPVFATWTRLDRAKGLDQSLRLIALLRQRGIDARFDLWGPDAGVGESLRALARRLGLADAIVFRGPLKRAALADSAKAARFTLQLSRIEGMGMGCVEAMQLGLVPVATGAGEFARYVIPGETGIRVDPARLDLAADSIQCLLADPAAYRALRRAAIERWSTAPLYGDDVAAAALRLAAQNGVG